MILLTIDSAVTGNCVNNIELSGHNRRSLMKSNDWAVGNDCQRNTGGSACTWLSMRTEWSKNRRSESFNT